MLRSSSLSSIRSSVHRGPVRFPQVAVFGCLAFLLSFSANAQKLEQFGAAMPANPAPVGLGAAIDEVSRTGSQTVKVKGTITQVCKKKGCWMALVDGERWARVTFKDYGFFVPTDSDVGSRRSTVYGELSLIDLPAQRASHYEEDAGGEGTAVEPVREFSLVATSVLIQAPGEL